MKPIQFEKFHGLGNDFVLFDAAKTHPVDFFTPNLVAGLCDRHFGVGADGLLFFELLEKNRRVRMIYFNADGSRAETCFNGLRCIALYAERIGAVQTGQNFIIESDAGDIKAYFASKNNLIEMELAGPDYSAGSVVKSAAEEAIDIELDFDHGKMVGTALSMGNPHFVSWIDGGSLGMLMERIAEVGGAVEASRHFRDGVNLELCTVIDAGSIEMAVWERGVGPTLACGSGAAAAVCAGVLTGRLEAEREVCVRMLGGDLYVTVAHDLATIFVRGDARHVYSGKVDPEIVIKKKK